MKTIFKNPEYKLTENDKNKFEIVQKRLSIKTAQQENDPKFRDKSHESTVTHIPSRKRFKSLQKLFLPLLIYIEKRFMCFIILTKGH